jgi:hypothetical protein
MACSVQFSTEMILAELSEIGILSLTFCLGWFTWSVVIRSTKERFRSKSLQGVDTKDSVTKATPMFVENDDAANKEFLRTDSPLSLSKLDEQRLSKNSNLRRASFRVWPAEFDATQAESEAFVDAACDECVAPVPTCHKSTFEWRRDSDVSTTAGSEVDEASDNESDSVDFKGFDDEKFSPAVLFEQYGLFGAVPGTWKID